MTSTLQSRAGTLPSDTEWGAERLDVAADLDRPGYHGALVPSRETLAALHRAHVATIPLENLDIVLG